MIRSLCVVLVLSLSSFVGGCAADTTEPAPAPAPAEQASEPTGDEFPAVETDTVAPLRRCPLPRKRPVNCESWICQEGMPGCGFVCGCWD